MAERKMKVLMVVLCFLPESVGGSEFYTYNLSQELRLRGYDVTVLAGLQDTTIERYTVIETTFEGLRVIKIVNSFYYARAFRDFFLDDRVNAIFKDLLGKERFDLVHFQHLPFLSGSLPEIAHGMKVPSVFTVHDYWYMCFRSQLLRPGHGPCPGPSGGVYCASCKEVDAPSPIAVPNPIATPKVPFLGKIMDSPFVRNLNLRERLSPAVKQKIKHVLYRQPVFEKAGEENPSDPILKEHTFRFEFFKRQFLYPRYVLSPSRHLKKRYEEVGYREFRHVPLGFYPSEKVESLVFHGILKIAYLGNVVPFKGAGVVVRELARLKKMHMHRVEAHIYGKPVNQSYYDEVRKAANQLPLGSVTFHGPYRSDVDMNRILSGMHLVVFPSLWEENYPLVVREALLHGIPVIGSRLGGVSEAIEDGVNGFLFDPYREGELAERIGFILDNPGALDKITQGARKTKIVSMDEHMEMMTGLYAEGAGRQDVTES